MFLILRSTVDSDMPSFMAISILEWSLTRRLKTSISSGVKLQTCRKNEHSSSVNSVRIFKGYPFFRFATFRAFSSSSLRLIRVPLDFPSLLIFAVILAI